MEQAHPIHHVYQSGLGTNRQLGIRVGDVVYLSRLGSPGHPSSEGPEGVRAQARAVLSELEAALRTQGSSLAELGRVVGYVRSAGLEREAVYDAWDKIFPDASDKPAFKVVDDPQLPDGVLVEMDALAVVGQRRVRFDLEGVDARDPTVRIGPYVFSSRLHGTSPETGLTGEGLEPQARQALANGIRLVELAGGSRASITQVCGFGKNLDYVPALRRIVQEEFADVGSLPELHAISTFVRPEIEAMVEVTASCRPLRPRSSRSSPTSHPLPLRPEA